MGGLVVEELVVLVLVVALVIEGPPQCSANGIFPAGAEFLSRGIIHRARETALGCPVFGELLRFWVKAFV